MREPTLIFKPTLANFGVAFTQYGILSDALHSSIIAGTATLITLLLATPMVYGLTRFRFPFRMGLLGWVLSLRMLPPIAIVIPFYTLYTSWRLNDTFPGLIIAYLPVIIPFGVWLMYSFAQDLPRSLDEAAMIDGSSRWQTFYNVILPLMRPAMAVTAIFCFLEIWNEFVLALILSGPNTKTVSIGMSEFITEHAVEWGPMAAASLVLLIPLLIVAYFLQNSLVRGLTLGSVR